MNLPQLHPEVVTLENEIQVLKEELAQLLWRKDELLTIVIPNIQAEYQVNIGYLELELFNLKIEVSRLKRLLSLIITAFNHGHIPDMNAINEILTQEFKKWEDKQKQRLAELEKSRVRLASLLSVEDSQKIRKIYYKLVKHLHTDLNPALPEELKWVWKQAVEAYKKGDLIELEALWVIVQEIHPGCFQSGQIKEQSIAEMRAEKTHLVDIITAIALELQEIESQPPYTLQSKLNDPNWMKGEQMRLGREIEQLKKKKTYLEDNVDVFTFDSDHSAILVRH